MHKPAVMTGPRTQPRILLVVGGGIAAYKACELVRTIRKEGGEVTCVLTEGGAHFVTPMALAALSENPVHTSLWDLKNEVEMGHIQLSRQADLIVVCPATANLMAKMAHGIADDLATTLLLATDKPVMAVPAMNVRMWQHDATMRNVQILRAAGVDVMEPDEGAMACGEFGPGRLPDPPAIWQRMAWALGLGPVDIVPVPGKGDESLPEQQEEHHELHGLAGLSGSMISRGLRKAKQMISFGNHDEDMADVLPLVGKGAASPASSTDSEALYPMPEAPFRDDAPLAGRHVLVTAGPTWEAIDPVRYIANRSSGKQGFAIAAAAAQAGGRVTLIAGPVALPTPPGVSRIDVESAREMAAAVEAALPADVAVMVAAVADWRPASEGQTKIKKQPGGRPPSLVLTENPDILAGIAAAANRPGLVIGFAAETNDVLSHATAKRARKGADWIIANDVSGDVMGGDVNAVHIVTADGVVSLPEMPKEDVGRALVARIAESIADAPYR